MRLICPNCSAQYEIDASLVPPEGRDVQCSNCGHSWFEMPPTEAALADQTASPAQLIDPVEEPAAEAAEPPKPDPKADNATHDEPKDEQDEGDPDDHAIPAAAAAVAATPKRPADAAALDILKEEAERELSQRRAPPSTALETQTDMGLDDIQKRDTPSRALRARMSTVLDTDPEAAPNRKGMTSAQVISDDDARAPRRDLLPDIDEINSTLKSTRQRVQPDQAQTEKRQRGFRTGFLAMAFVTIALIFTYAQAPAIARALPGSETALIPYVDKANAVRDWIDGLLGTGA